MTGPHGLQGKPLPVSGCSSWDNVLAEENWRKLRGLDYLAKVITGVKFTDGIETTNNQAAA